MAGLKLGEAKLEKDLSLSRSMAPMPPLPFFLDFVDILRLRVWIPSFFIVSGRGTCNDTESRWLGVIVVVVVRVMVVAVMVVVVVVVVVVDDDDDDDDDGHHDDDDDDDYDDDEADDDNKDDKGLDNGYDQTSALKGADDTPTTVTLAAE